LNPRLIPLSDRLNPSFGRGAAAHRADDQNEEVLLKRIASAFLVFALALAKPVLGHEDHGAAGQTQTQTPAPAPTTEPSPAPAGDEGAEHGHDHHEAAHPFLSHMG